MLIWCFSVDMVLDSWILEMDLHTFKIWICHNIHANYVFHVSLTQEREYTNRLYKDELIAIYELETFTTVVLV